MTPRIKSLVSTFSCKNGVMECSTNTGKNIYSNSIKNGQFALFNNASNHIKRIHRELYHTIAPSILNSQFGEFLKKSYGENDQFLNVGGCAEIVVNTLEYYFDSSKSFYFCDRSKNRQDHFENNMFQALFMINISHQLDITLTEEQKANYQKYLNVKSKQLQKQLYLEGKNPKQNLQITAPKIAWLTKTDRIGTENIPEEYIDTFIKKLFGEIWTFY